MSLQTLMLYNKLIDNLSSSFKFLNSYMYTENDDCAILSTRKSLPPNSTQYTMRFTIREVKRFSDLKDDIIDAMHDYFSISESATITIETELDSRNDKDKITSDDRIIIQVIIRDML